jgi:hypothetical protein
VGVIVSILLSRHIFSMVAFLAAEAGGQCSWRIYCGLYVLIMSSWRGRLTDAEM